MEPSSYLDHIERLKEQNRHETDPVMRFQNNETIEFLHREYRRKARHRPPIYAFLGFVAALAVALLLIALVLLIFGAFFGYGHTAQMAMVAAKVFGIIAVVVLVFLGVISPEIFADLFTKLFGGLALPVGASKPSDSSRATLPDATVPKSENLPAPRVDFDRDPPQPKSE